MPIYEETGVNVHDLLELRKRNKCKECGGMLNVFLDGDTHKAYLACNSDQSHEGIEREYREPRELNIPTRREEMEENYGKETTTALDKARLPMTGALTQPQAMHILKLVYPDVPEDQIIRTAILCRDFGLHPLMKEIVIIGFRNSKTGKVDYSSVITIKANRKMAADKKGSYSFLDATPRMASKEEVIKQYGQNSEEEKANLISICILQGERGNQAIGFGLWPKDTEPHGTNKGNTKRNMSNTRSERQALDRLPGEALPLRHLEVIDEAYAEVPDIGKGEEKLGDVVEGEFKEVGPEEHWCSKHNCAFTKKRKYEKDYWSHPLPSGKWCNEKGKEEPAPPAPPHIPESIEELPSSEPEKPDQPAPEPIEEMTGHIKTEWLKESLATLQNTGLSAWKESILLSYMKASYKVDAKTVLECAALLDKGAANHFVKRIQDTLDMA